MGAPTNIALVGAVLLALALAILGRVLRGRGIK